MSQVHQSLAMQTMLSDLATPNPTNPRSQGWLAKKVQIFSLTFVLISSLHAEVIGDGSVPFYLRRPQSRIRINMRAHIGFCGRWTIILSSICPSFSFFPNPMFLLGKTYTNVANMLLHLYPLPTLPSFLFLSLLRLPALLHLLPSSSPSSSFSGAVHAVVPHPASPLQLTSKRQQQGKLWLIILTRIVIIMVSLLSTISIRSSVLTMSNRHRPLNLGQ